jgi:hypothetical protein
MQRHLLESGHLLGSRLVRLRADCSQNLQLRQGSLSSPTLYQCFGCYLLVAGTVRIRIQLRILLSSSKNSEKNLDSYCFVTSL